MVPTTTTAAAPSVDARWRMISQTGEYALRVVLHLGRRDRTEWNAAAAMGERLGIPVRYLSRVLNALARAGILDSVRGPHGGFRLARSPAELTLAAVVAPFDAVGDTPSCLLRDQRCGVGEPCMAHQRWHGIAGEVRRFFQETTIAALVAEASSSLPREAEPIRMDDGAECR